MKSQVSYNSNDNKFEVLSEVEMNNVLGGTLPRGLSKEEDVFDPDQE